MTELDTYRTRSIRPKAFVELRAMTDSQVMTTESLVHNLAYAMQITVPEARFLVTDYLRAQEGY